MVPRRKPRAPCVMHPHGLLSGVRWYRGTWLWPLQVVPVYRCNHKLSFFPNLTSKATAWKEFYLKQRMFWISKIFIQIPYLALIKRFQNPKLYQNKPLFGVKTTFKKGGIWKSFVPLTSLSSKILILFQMNWKPCSYFKMLCEKMLQTLCFCP